MMGFHLLLMLLMLLICPRLATCSGYMTIEFISYTSDGTTVSGKPCDDATSRGASDLCDPQFRLSADKSTKGGKAEYFYQQVNYYSNQDIVHFGSKFGQVPNPIVIGMNYDNNTGTLWIEVEVRDVDIGHGGQLMSLFYASLKASGTELHSLKVTNGTSSLSLNYRYSCHANYYGLLCNTYCRISDSSEYGHSWCTSSGEKVCLFGWVDASTGCKKPHPCRTCVCKNGGTCVPQGEGFTCQCPPDYSGTNCDTCDSRLSRCNENGATEECGCDLTPIQSCAASRSYISRSSYIGFIVAFSFSFTGAAVFIGLFAWKLLQLRRLKRDLF